MDIHTEQSWGAYINDTGYRSRPIPEPCLTWATPADKSAWEERGVVIWSNQAQRVEVLSANHALQLLDYMRTEDTWQREGIPITRREVRLVIEDTRKKKRGRKKDKAPSEVEEKASEPGTVLAERFRLSPDQSTEFLRILETNESVLRQMADEDEKKESEALRQVYSFLLKGVRESEASEIDFSARSFTWEKDAHSTTWICDRPPNRGSVVLAEGNLFWQGCIEQPARFKHWSPYQAKLEEALTWVEQQLEAAEQEASEPKEEGKRHQVPIAELIAQKREELIEYWVDPTALEPERITYQAIINLDYAPYDYKTMEMSFGEKFSYDKEFASPTQLASELQLDPQLDVEQRFDGLYTLVSRVTYYREDIAVAQAQRFWEESSIVQQHRAGKVIRAQYGYVEVEPGYQVIIGACESPDQPYPPEKSREEHLAWLGLGKTLEYALDVEGYRSYLGLSPEHVSDEKLLEIMHSHRAKSPHVSLEEQLESERWLRVNKVK